MSVFQALQDALPTYARDVALSFAAVEAQPGLSSQQFLGAVLASAEALGEPTVVQAARRAAGDLPPEAVAAAKGAAALMAQNNVYFRATALMADPVYRSMRSGLRMGLVRNPGTDVIDFHLWCVAVSAVNGCQDCLNEHEGALRARGVSPETVQAALRIAAVVHATARVLGAEAAARRPSP